MCVMSRSKDQMNLLSEAAIVYTSEFERFVTFIRYFLSFYGLGRGLLYFLLSI